MPKRKHDIEYYLKKLKSIEKGLKRKFEDDEDADSNNSESFELPQDNIVDNENEDDDNIVPEAQDLENSVAQNKPDKDTLPPAGEVPTRCATNAPSTSNAPSAINAPSTTNEPSITNAPSTQVPTTSPDVLLALGDLMPDKPTFGPPINSDLARIWSTILRNGITKELKEKLSDKLIPENCALLKAPKLNPEIVASVSDVIVNRDKKIELEQGQLGIGLTILSSALSSLINNETVDRLKLISILSEAGRVLTDLHHVQTKSRRNLVFPVLDKKFLDVIKDVERDEYLYGKNLTEKIKSLQSVQRSGKTIKKVAPALNRQGNSNAPPRFNHQKTASRGGYKKMQSSTYPRKHPAQQQYQSTVKKQRAPPAKQPAARP